MIRAFLATLCRTGPAGRGLCRGPWRLFVGLLGGLLVCGCAARRAALEQAPAPKTANGERLGPDHEPTPDVEVDSEQTTIEIRDPQGQLVWVVSGRLRSSVSGEIGTFELLDIQATSRLPDYPATLSAGRLRYRLGDDWLVVDRRIFLGSPERQADLEADSARYDFPTRQFIVPDRARVRTPQAVLEAAEVTAAVDLREVTLTHPTAHDRAEPATWRLAAETGHVAADGTALFETVTGSLVREGVTTGLEAPRAAWKPGPRWLNCNAGATLRRPGFEITAAALTWQQADHLVVTRGATTLTRDTLRATGTGARVDLLHRTGQLEQITVTAPQATLRADRGEVTAAGDVRLQSLRGTVDGATTLSAAQAIYRPATKQVELPSGGSASRDGQTMSAGRATYAMGTRQFTASGGVRLTDPAGTVTGDRLTGPGDLTSATLSPVTANGRQGGQAWHLTATSGTWRRGGALDLSQARARITWQQRQVTASAAAVRYEPGAGRLVFSGGFEAASPADGARVTAQRAVYRLDTRTFSASGNVMATAKGIAIKNAGTWTYHVGAAGAGPLMATDSARPARTAPTSPGPAKPGVSQDGNLPTKEASPAAAKESARAGEGGEGAVTDATGAGDRPGPGDGQGSELPGPDAGDAGAPGR